MLSAVDGEVRGRRRGARGQRAGRAPRRRGPRGRAGWTWGGTLPRGRSARRRRYGRPAANVDACVIFRLGCGHVAATRPPPSSAPARPASPPPRRCASAASRSLLRGLRPGRRQLGLRQQERDVGGLPRPAHQHVARAHGVLGLPDAEVLSGLSRTTRRSPSTSTPTSTTSASATRSASRPRVEHAERGADGIWELDADDGRDERYDALLVANGHHWNPRWPEPALPRRATRSRATQMHAHDYVDNEELAGKDVVVLGHGQQRDGHRGRVLLRRRAHVTSPPAAARGSSRSTSSAGRSTSSRRPARCRSRSGWRIFESS